MLDVRCLIEKSLRMKLFICIPRSIHLRRRNLLTWHLQSSCHLPSMIKMHLSLEHLHKPVSIIKQKPQKTTLRTACSASLILICRFKFCSSQLDSPCPTSYNSLRLAALSEKPQKLCGNLQFNKVNPTGNTPLIFQVFRRNGCCPARVVVCLDGIV